MSFIFQVFMARLASLNLWRMLPWKEIQDDEEDDDDDDDEAGIAVENGTFPVDFPYLK